MKQIFQYKLLLVLSLVLVFTSCTKDWEELNDNPNKATDPPATNIFAYTIRYFADNFYDDWQDMNNYETYVGHLGKIQYIDEAGYRFRVGVVNDAWSDVYTTMNNLEKVITKAEEEKNVNLQAAAITWKAYILQIATDKWRDIPYTEALRAEEGDEYLNPAYDSQSKIYAELLTMLEEANGLYNPSIPTALLGDGDLIFGGDISLWKKFTNSLRLRVAIRISNVDAATAQSHIEAILGNPTDYPIISSNAENAQLAWQGSSPYYEPWYENAAVDNRDDHGMGKPLIDSLLNYNDPRLSVYAKPASTDSVYRGVIPGANPGSFNMADISRIGDHYRGTPDGYTPFLRYPEIQFIIAEAALNGWNTGGVDAQTAYEAAVTASLEEHGITGDTAYLQQPPVAWGSGYMTNYEKIYIQKWISLFKQGHEAWAEARRTDVPLCEPAPYSPYEGHDRAPFRYPYPDDEYNLNSANINAVDNSQDDFWGEQMWWDTRTGVQ